MSEGFDAEDKVVRQLKFSRTAPIALKMASDLMMPLLNRAEGWSSNGTRQFDEHIYNFRFMKVSQRSLKRKPTYSNS